LFKLVSYNLMNCVTYNIIWQVCTYPPDGNVFVGGPGFLPWESQLTTVYQLPGPLICSYWSKLWRCDQIWAGI